MKVKKYEGPTMQKALAEVKKDLGPDAVILHTKTKKVNGIFGLWGKEMVEITASPDVRVMEKKKPAPAQHVLKQYSQVMQPTFSSNQVKAPTAQTDVDLLHSDIHEVKSLVMSLLKRTKYTDVAHMNDELLETYLLLIEQEVSEELSKDIIAKVQTELGVGGVQDKKSIHQCLQRTIVKMIPAVQPITLTETGRAKKVALIGPTGVGKTTTIAKLAAEFSLRQKKDVALITIDTYRIAAVEQLRTYADIINIPLEVVLTPHEITQALEKHKHRDLILIDTAGRSQKNAMQMTELQTYIKVIDPHETHLVLSTTTNCKNVQDIIGRFNSLSIDKLIFTKLDEAVSFGLILNVMEKLNKTLSYVTTGQNVPDDIAISDPRKLAELIMKGTETCM